MKRILVVGLAAAVPAVMWSCSLSPSWIMVASLMALFLCVRDLCFKNAFRLGTLYGFVLYGISLSWLWQIFSGAAIALWLILALFCGFACGMIGWAGARWKNASWHPLYVAAVWTAVEYFRCEWFTLRFPWMTAGTAMGPLALSPWIGVYGVSFIAALLAALMLTLRQGIWQRVCCALLVIVLVIPVKKMPAVGEADGIPVMAVQSENCDFFTYYEHSKNSDFRDGVILWPEYSSFEDSRIAKWGREQRSGLTMLTELASEKNSIIILGQSRDEGGKHYNEALVVDANGILGSHDKNRPVHLMNDGTPGTRAEPVKTRFGNIGTPICFDNDYTEVPRRMAAAGAQVFLVPSMDAQRWTARQHWQHGELFRLRAAETGRWYVVCATSGVTQRICPDGRRHEQLPLMEDGILRTHMAIRSQQTPYVQYGWLFPYLITAAALLWTIALYFAARKLSPAPVEP
jgi:apolipoprotein N-acyltransferase